MKNVFWLSILLFAFTGLTSNTRTTLKPTKQLQSTTTDSLLVPCRKNERWGYCLSPSKKIIIPPDNYLVYPFQGNVGRMEKNNKSGAINKAGKIVIPFQYENISMFINSISIAFKGKTRVLLSS